MKTENITINYQNQTLRGYLDLPEDGQEDLQENVADSSLQKESRGDVANNLPDRPLDIVIQLHGMCGQCDSKIDLALAAYFTSRHKAVIRVNFLAHGNSDGDFFKVTIPDEVLQAREILAYARALPYAGRIILVGHSMGAAVATLLAGEQPEDIDTMILLAPASVIERLCQTGDFGDFTFDPSDPPEKIEIPGTRFKFSREYLVTGKYMDIMGHAAAYPKPVCVIHGQKDAFLPMAEIEDFVRAFPHASLCKVEGASHFFNGTKDKMVECIDRFLLRQRESQRER